MLRKPILFVLLASFLSSCGGTPNTSSSTKGSDSTISSSSESTESSSSKTSSSSSAINPPAPGQGAWDLNYSAIPETEGNDYNLDFDFSTVSGTGVTQGFHGNNLRRGKGTYNGLSVEKTIEMKAGESYIYSTTAKADFFRVAILQIKNEGGEDITGTPSFYVGSEVGLKGGEETEFNKEVLENQNIILYSYLLGTNGFRIENKTSNPIYLISLSYPE